MKLEVGKSYRNREGKVIKIVNYKANEKYKFIGEDEDLHSNSYDSNGRWTHYQLEHPLDLIEEVVDQKPKFHTSTLTVIESGNFEVTRINNSHIHIKNGGESFDVDLKDVDTLCEILQQLKEL